MRIRKLRIFTLFFIIFVLIAVYGLALLRTFVFKPPASAANGCTIFLASGKLNPSGEIVLPN